MAAKETSELIEEGVELMVKVVDGVEALGDGEGLGVEILDGDGEGDEALSVSVNAQIDDQSELVPVWFLARTRQYQVSVVSEGV